MTHTGPRTRYVQPSAVRFIATFGYAWVTIALIACSVVMLIATRFNHPLVRAFSLGPSGQRQLVLGTIAVLVVCSFMIGRRVVRSLYRGAPRTRNIALLALGVLAVGCAFTWAHL